MRQQTVNGRMRPVKGAPDPMQRLSRFPAAPQLRPLRHRKLHVFPLGQGHHLGTEVLYQMVLHRPIETTALIGT
jgi:hypothetical protein